MSKNVKEIRSSGYICTGDTSSAYPIHNGPHKENRSPVAAKGSAIKYATRNENQHHHIQLQSSGMSAGGLSH